MTWPDTVEQDPPGDHLYLSATWLLGQYPQFAVHRSGVGGVGRRSLWMELRDFRLSFRLSSCPFIVLL